LRLLRLYCRGRFALGSNGNRGNFCCCYRVCRCLSGHYFIIRAGFFLLAFLATRTMTLAARTIITNLRATLGFSAHGGSVFRCLLSGFFRTAIIAFLTLRTRRAFRLRAALLTLTTLTVISALSAFR